jgi:hypothetical protein
MQCFGLAGRWARFGSSGRSRIQNGPPTHKPRRSELGRLSAFGSQSSVRAQEGSTLRVHSGPVEVVAAVQRCPRTGRNQDLRRSCFGGLLCHLVLAVAQTNNRDTLKPTTARLAILPRVAVGPAETISLTPRARTAAGRIASGKASNRVVVTLAFGHLRRWRHSALEERPAVHPAAEDKPGCGVPAARQVEPVSTQSRRGLRREWTGLP